MVTRLTVIRLSIFTDIHPTDPLSSRVGKATLSSGSPSDLNGGPASTDPKPSTPVPDPNEEDDGLVLSEDYDFESVYSDDLSMSTTSDITERPPPKFKSQTSTINDKALVRIMVTVSLRSIDLNGHKVHINMQTARFHVSGPETFYLHDKFLTKLESKAKETLMKHEPFPTLQALKHKTEIYDPVFSYKPHDPASGVKFIIQRPIPALHHSPPPKFTFYRRKAQTHLSATFQAKILDSGHSSQKWHLANYPTTQKATVNVVERLKQVAAHEHGLSPAEVTAKLHELYLLFKMESKRCYMREWPTSIAVPFSDPNRAALVPPEFRSSDPNIRDQRHANPSLFQVPQQQVHDRQVRDRRPQDRRPRDAPSQRDPRIQARYRSLQDRLGPVPPQDTSPTPALPVIDEDRLRHLFTEFLATTQTGRPPTTRRSPTPRRTSSTRSRSPRPRDDRHHRDDRVVRDERFYQD